MAGQSNPLLDLFTREGGLDAARYGNLADGIGYSSDADDLLREQKRARRAAAREARRARRGQQQRIQDLQAGIKQPEQPQATMGDVRQAEQREKLESTPYEGDPRELVAQRKLEAQRARELIAAYEDETATIDPYRTSEAEIKQRLEKIAASRGDIEAFDKQTSELEARIALMQQDQGDPTLGQRLMGMAGDAADAWDRLKSEDTLQGATARATGSAASWIIDKLAIAQETAAGVASLGAEAVGGKYAQSNIDVGLTDVLPRPVLMGREEDDPLRQRGREFNQKVGRVLGITEDAVMDSGIPLGPVGQGLQLLRGAEDRVEESLGFRDGTLTDMRYQLAFEIATDPLNVIDASAGALSKGLAAGYKAAKMSPMGQKLIAKAPWLVKPEKWWLSLAGTARDAHVAGTPLEQYHAAQKAFEKRTDFEAMKIKQEATQEAAAILNGMREERIKAVLGVVPKLVERGAEARAAARLGLADISYKPFRELPEVEQAVALRYADAIDKYNVQIKAWENRIGMQVSDLTDEFDYLGREFSDEFKGTLAADPKGRESVMRFKDSVSTDALTFRASDPEMGRVLRGLEYEAAAKVMREKLGLPADFKVWRDDFLPQIGDRAMRSAEKAKRRHMATTFAQHFGAPPADDVVAAAAKAMPGYGEVRMADALKDLSPAERAELLRHAARLKAEADAAAVSATKAGQEAAGVRAGADVARQEAETAASAAAASKAQADSYARAAAEAKAEYRATSAKGEQAQAAHKKAYDEYFAAQDKFNKAADDTARAAANAEMQRATKDLLSAKAALKAAKASAGPERIKAAERVVREAEAAEAAARASYDDAQTAYAKAQKVYREKEAAWQDAEAAWKQADAEAAASRDRMANLRVPPDAADAERMADDGWNAMSGADKGKWVKAQLTRGRVQLPDTSALDVMLANKGNIPDNVDDLVRLAMTRIDPADRRAFEEYSAIANPYSHLVGAGESGKSRILKYYDGIMRIFQRATLGRVASLSKDAIGTSVHGALFAGTLPYLPAARKAMGNLSEWQKGTKAVPDWVLRLRAEGVLRTTMGEALEKPGVFEAVNNPMLRGVLTSVEKHGMLGAALGGGAKGKLGAPGRLVGKATDAINDARVYVEELNRAAAYLKAVQSGMSHDEAVIEVFKFFGNFSELSQLQRGVLGRIQFFWTWRLKSIPITLRRWLDQPARSRWLLTMIAGDAQEDDSAPEWLVRQGGKMLGIDQNGNASAIGMGGNTFFSPTLALLQGDFARNMAAGKPVEAASGLGMDFIRGTPPFLQEPLGMAFQTEPFSGKPYFDPDTGQSQVLAPIAFYHLRNTKLGEFLNVREIVKDGHVRKVVMDPYRAALMGMVPGLEPLATDVSSFVDPRAADVGENISLRKGLARNALGLPIYHFPPEDKRMVAVRDGRKALHESVNSLPGHGLIVLNGQVVPSNQTERGQQMIADRRMWESAAMQTGKGEKAARAYVDIMMESKYPNEQTLILFDRFLRAQSETFQETKKPRVTEADRGYKKLTVKERIEEQDMRELARRRARLGFR